MKTRMFRLTLATAACVSLGCATAASAEVVLMTSQSAWSAALGGGDATLDFIGLDGFLSDEYASLGVHFLPGSTVVGSTSHGDNFAISTTFSFGYQVTIDFETLQYGVGLKPISLFSAALYLQGSLVYQSPPLTDASNKFRGFVSSQAFDRVVFKSLNGGPGGIDNVYIGNPIPGPGVVVALAAFGALGASRRRRRWRGSR